MTDVIVVGSGVAGLSAALSAAETGARVTVITKASLTLTATDRAQGGMAAMTSSLPDGQPKDSVQLHVQDTLVAGAVADAAVDRIGSALLAPALAYGATGNSGIAPDETLVFVVDLVSATPAASTTTVAPAP